MKNNVVLIGMPGVGKSTVGVVLAKRLGFRFLDSDLVIQEREGKLLHQLITEHGIDGFLELENRINAGIATHHAVIATGGSVVYGKEAMEHFKEKGIVVYLKLSCSAIEYRLGDLQERGVTLRKGQDLKGLYEERVPLYEKYADMVIECENRSIREVTEEIAERVKGYK